MKVEQKGVKHSGAIFMRQRKILIEIVAPLAVLKNIWK